MGTKWTKERAWEWYDARPWLRGCNYMSADCANRIDQWQSYGWEERFATTEEELKLMQETGFNTVRLIVEYGVWKGEHDFFMAHFDRYLDLCAKYGISCMITLANDCMPPKGEGWCVPYLGEQKYDWGYHGGRKRSQHSMLHTGPAPHYYLDDPDTREDYFKMVREIVETYKNDERVCIWDIYNEPGNSRRYDITLPNLKALFEIVREIDPSQPLTCGIFHFVIGEEITMNEVEQYALDHSDIVSYHFYRGYEDHVRLIKWLKTFGRPILNTEWLGRCLDNDIFRLFPLFYMEKIGCYNWGFVAGKYQTYEPWEGTWQRWALGTEGEVDFTKWFHDLYRPNHRPYDPKEIDLIKKFCALADKDFEKEQRK